jgi:hypothetical protein
MGGHDVPDWLLSEISVLSKIVRAHARASGPVRRRSRTARARPQSTDVRPHEADLPPGDH